MRVLVTTFPALGHFHPIAPLALALQRAGHEVRVATGADRVDWVRRCGLTAVPAGLTEPRAVARARATAPPGAPFGPHMFADVTPAPMLRDLLRLSRHWRPELVLHEESEYAAPLLAAVLGVPCVTHSWPAPVAPRGARRSAGEQLAGLWADSAAGPARIHGDLYLDGCPPLLQSDEVDSVEAPVVRVRAEPFDGPEMPAPDEVVRLARPCAYVSFGTVPSFADAAALARAAGAVATEVASAVVTCGPGEPALLDGLGSNVHVRRYLAQQHVLPHADVVVSHGGAGTTLGALVHGVPHLVLPQGAPSQTRVGVRVAASGAGIHLAPGEQQPTSIRASVRRLLDESSFRQAAGDAAAALQELPGPDEVARDLGTRAF